MFLNYFSNRGFICTGLEFDLSLVTRLGSNYPKIKFFCVDEFFCNNSHQLFSYIHLGDVLEHIDSPVEYLEQVIKYWETDSVMDQTEPSKELLRIPVLHSKYLNILSRHRLLAKEAEFKYNRLKRIKWEYYTGKLDDDTLRQYGWEPFPFVLKSDISTYLDSDEDMNRVIAQKALNEEMVDSCNAILKELNNRTWQLRDFIAWERFIQGA